MRNLIIFITLSLLIHLSSYEGVNVLVTHWLKERKPQETLEIQVIENPIVEKITSPTKKPLVHQLEPFKPIENNKLSRFESEKTQRVLKETKAREFGLTKNKTSASSSAFPQQAKVPTFESGDTPEFARRIETRIQNAASKVSLDLPNDIQYSDTTNLNTDANIYYSFYNRVEELYRVRWEERLNSYWNRLSAEFKRNTLSGKVWTTTFEIVLKASGEYSSSTLLQSSGYPPFDEAAIFSFKNARYFPNVPRAKVEPDGLVRLRYRFSVHVGP